MARISKGTQDLVLVILLVVLVLVLGMNSQSNRIRSDMLTLDELIKKYPEQAHQLLIHRLVKPKSVSIFKY